MVNHPILRVLGVALALSILLTALPAPAFAAPTPPVANRRLIGSWVNNDPATRGIKQIVIRGVRGGGLTVNAYGACGGGLCDWGSVPATVYGTNVSATRGARFQTNQRFLSGESEFARTVLLGRVRSSASGLRLTVRSMTVFTDGSARRNYSNVHHFSPGEAQAPTKSGHAVADYELGLPPATVAGMFGSWKNASPTGGIAALTVSGSASVPLVRAWGACTPTPCDMGTVRGITYGTSIASAKGRTVLAPYTFGFKEAQVIVRYSRSRDGREALTVAHYNEFTDGSGRSNYVRTERFVRS